VPASASSTSARRVHACEPHGQAACGRACEANDALACRVYGRQAYTATGVTDDAKHAAIVSLKKGCTLGDATACSLAGTWSRRHAAHGDPRYTRGAWVALFERGCMLEAGPSCAILAEHLLAETPNSPRALELYERSCTTNPASCVHAANMLEHRNQPGDAERVTALRADACKRGHLRACRTPQR
jgi:hypothetical protein